jgi:hypothetical protein
MGLFFKVPNCPDPPRHRRSSQVESEFVIPEELVENDKPVGNYEMLDVRTFLMGYK